MKMFFKHIILLIFGVLMISINAHSQQSTLYSQYFLNRFIINPACAGANGYSSVDLTSRQQWLGFKDAPQTNVLAFQTRMLKKSYMSRMRSVRRSGGGAGKSGPVGLGGFVFSDQSGLVNYSGLQGTYAYHINMRDAQLSFGISASLYQFKLDDKNIILYPGEEDDALLNSTNHKMLIPDAAVGVYYMYQDIYAGISANQLMQSAIRFGDVNFKEAKMLRYYYLTSGFNYPVGRFYSIEPSVLFKANELLKTQMDINVRGFFKDEYWFGLSYRTGGKSIEDSKNSGTMILLAGVHIDMLYFGYAFDYGFNSIQKYNMGSHEINVALRFGDNARRHRWISR